MAIQRTQAYISPEQYQEIQRTAEYPSEYLDGEMIAMSGTSKAHGQIVTALSWIMVNALLGKPCEASAGIAVEAPASYLIPDLVVYCDGGEFSLDNEDLRNPTVIFEVLSDTTALYDRGRKWMRYRQLDSLMHYVLISQYQPSVEVFSREKEGGWHYETVSGMNGRVRLAHLDLQIQLKDLYNRVAFVAESPES